MGSTTTCLPDTARTNFSGCTKSTLHLPFSFNIPRKVKSTTIELPATATTRSWLGCGSGIFPEGEVTVRSSASFACTSLQRAASSAADPTLGTNLRTKLMLVAGLFSALASSTSSPKSDSVSAVHSAKVAVLSTNLSRQNSHLAASAWHFLQAATWQACVCPVAKTAPRPSGSCVFRVHLFSAKVR